METFEWANIVTELRKFLVEVKAILHAKRSNSYLELSFSEN